MSPQSRINKGLWAITIIISLLVIQFGVFQLTQAQGGSNPGTANLMSASQLASNLSNNMTADRAQQILSHTKQLSALQDKPVEAAQFARQNGIDSQKLGELLASGAVTNWHVDPKFKAELDKLPPLNNPAPADGATTTGGTTDGGTTGGTTDGTTDGGTTTGGTTDGGTTDGGTTDSGTTGDAGNGTTDGGGGETFGDSGGGDSSRNEVSFASLNKNAFLSIEPQPSTELAGQTGGVFFWYTNSENLTMTLYDDGVLEVTDASGNVVYDGILFVTSEGDLILQGTDTDGNFSAATNDGHVITLTAGGDLILTDWAGSFTLSLDDSGSLSIVDEDGSPYAVSEDDAGNVVITDPDGNTATITDSGDFQIVDPSGNVIIEGNLADIDEIAEAYYGEAFTGANPLDEILAETSGDTTSADGETSTDSSSSDDTSVDNSSDDASADTGGDSGGDTSGDSGGDSGSDSGDDSGGDSGGDGGGEG